MANSENISFDDLPDVVPVNNSQESSEKISFDNLPDAVPKDVPQDKVSFDDLPDVQDNQPIDPLKPDVIPQTPSSEVRLNDQLERVSFDDLPDKGSPEASLSSEEFKSYVPPTTYGPVSRGLRSGIKTLQKDIVDVLPAMAYKVLGNKEAQQQQLNEAAAKDKAIEKYFPAPFKSVQDALEQGKTKLEKASNLWEQTKYLSSNMAIQATPMLIGAVTGSALAPEVAVGTALEEGAAAIAEIFAKRQAKKTLYSAAGAYTAGEPQMLAESYINRLNETGVDSPVTAALASSISNAIFTVVPVKIASALIPKPMIQQLQNDVLKVAIRRATLGSVSKELATTFLVGGASGAGMTVTEKLANKIVADNYELFSKENLDHLIDSTYGGATGAVFMHAGTQIHPTVMGYLRNKRDVEGDYTASGYEGKGKEASQEEINAFNESKKQQKTPVEDDTPPVITNERLPVEVPDNTRISLQKDETTALNAVKTEKSKLPQEGMTTQHVYSEGPLAENNHVDKSANKAEIPTQEVDHSQHTAAIGFKLDTSNYPKTSQGSHQISRDYLAHQEKATTFEHMNYIDRKSGVIKATTTSNNQKYVDHSPYGRTLVNDSTLDLHLDHNHPDTVYPTFEHAPPLSQNDLTQLINPAVNSISARGIKGEYSNAELTPVGHEFLDSTKTGTKQLEGIVNLAKRASKEVYAQLIKEGSLEYVPNTWTTTEAAHRALADTGFIDYSSNHLLSTEESTRVDLIRKKVYDQLLEHLNTIPKWKDANEKFGNYFNRTNDRRTASRSLDGGLAKLYGRNVVDEALNAADTKTNLRSATNDGIQEKAQTSSLEPTIYKDENGNPTLINPDPIGRHLDGLKPTDKLKFTNSGRLVEILDNILNKSLRVDGLRPFQNLLEGISSPENSLYAGNLLHIAMNLRNPGEFRTLIGDGTHMGELLQYVLKNPESFLTEKEYQNLLAAKETLIKREVAKGNPGLEIADVALLSEHDIISNAFIDYMLERQVPDKKLNVSFGKAEPVFQKIGDMLNQMSTVLKDNGIKGTIADLLGVSKDNIGDALNEVRKNRNLENEGRRISDNIFTSVKALKTVSEGGTPPGKDTPEDLFMNPEKQDPKNIKHINLHDSILATMQHIATMYPWMTPIHSHFRLKLENVSRYSKLVGDIPRRLMIQRPNVFVDNMSILAEARMAGEKVQIVTDPQSGLKTMMFPYEEIVDGVPVVKRRIIKYQQQIEDLQALQKTFEIARKINEDGVRKELSKLGFDMSVSPDQIRENVKRLQEQLDKEEKEFPNSTLLTPLKFDLRVKEALADSLEHVLKMKSTEYAPFVRPSNAGIVLVYERTPEEGLSEEQTKMAKKKVGKLYRDKLENTDDKLVALLPIERTNDGKVNVDQEARKDAFIKERYSDPEKYYVLGNNPKDRQSFTHHNTLKQLNPKHITAEMLYSIYGDGTPKQLEAFEDYVQKQVALHQSPFYMRESANIRGHLGEMGDWGRAIETWIHGFALANANKDSQHNEAALQKHIDNINQDESYTPNDRKFMNSYVDYNKDRATDMMLPRQANFIWQMGASARTAIVQFLTGPQAMTAALSVGGSNPAFHAVGWLRSFAAANHVFAKTLGRTGIDIRHDPSSVKRLMKFGGLSEEGAQLIIAADKTHLLESVLIDPLLGTSHETSSLKGKSRKALQGTSMELGRLVSNAEKISRYASLISLARNFDNPEFFRRMQKEYVSDPAYSAYREANIKYTDKQALAYYLLEKVHGQYGKAGRGRLQRGLPAVLLSPFSTFSLTQYELMWDLAKRRGTGGRLGAAWLIGTTLGLSGLQGLMYYQLIKSGANLFNTIENDLQNIPDPAKDFDYSLLQFLENKLGAKWADRILKGSAREITGIDVRGSTSLPSPSDLVLAPIMDMTNTVLKGQQPNLLQHMGPAAGILQQASNAAFSHDWSQLLPVAAKNAWMGLVKMNPNEPGSGIESSKGKMVLPSVDKKTGEPTFTTGQRIEEGLGLTPTEIQRAREQKTFQDWKENKDKVSVSGITDKAVMERIKALRSRSPEEKSAHMRAAQQAVQDFRNFKHEQTGRWPTFEELMAFHRNLNNKVKEQLDPSSALSKKQKQELPKIKELFRTNEQGQ